MDIDNQRLMRATRIAIYEKDSNGEPLPPFHYMTIDRGSESLEPHYCSTIPDMACDCGDFLWRLQEASPCKHLIRAFLYDMSNRFVLEAAEGIGLDVSAFWRGDG